jgi:hypothetical protein
MAGTDALVPVTISGFLLHKELEELIGIGLTSIAAVISFGTAHLVRQIPGVKKVL